MILSATIVYMLADTLVGQGLDEEAERFSRTGEELADPNDIDAQVRWRRARARASCPPGAGLQRRRSSPGEALDLVADTDALNDHAHTLLDLAEVLRTAGRQEDAAVALSDALELYERKENVAMAAQARRVLAGSGR